jgi:hypothetical protein
MCASSPFPTSANDDLLENQLQRYQRVLGFAGGFARAKRREFDVVWARPQAFGPKAVEFVKRVEALGARVAEGENVLRYAKGQPARAAFNALGAFDLNAVTAATKGLETMAAELKEHPGIQAAVAGLLAAPDPRKPGTGPLQAFKAATGPLDGKGTTGRLAEMMRSWIAPASVVKAGPSPEVLEAQKADRAFEQNRQALESAIDLVVKVLKSVSPRLHVIQVALDATGLPGKAKEWEAIEDEIPEAGEAAGFSAAQVGWLFHLADLFTADMKAMQAAHMATVQWGQARALLGEAETVRETMKAAPPAKSVALLKEFNLGRFRASVFPLSHLHLSFRGMPLLQDLFPEPT